jgi:hypothetical protein
MLLGGEAVTYLPGGLDTPELFAWNDLDGIGIPWRGLLLGNGASIAVADSFAYPSLYEIACDDPDRLGGESRQLFEAFATQNFELVLASLKVAGRVCAAAGIAAPQLPQLYQEIQRALFVTVGDVHVPWNVVADVVLPRIRQALLNYKLVYSTNYDLLAYWSMLREGDPNDFRDYFWGDGNSFDVTDLTILGDPTVIYYLHGGLHLRHTTEGGTFKRTAQEQNLLAQFETSWEESNLPLMISEGTSDDKLEAIARSDYLSFAYQRFAEHTGNLVVFGSHLGEADEHLVRAMNSWTREGGRRNIAIGIRPAHGDAATRQEKQRLAQRLSEANLWFFDADSHPLGQPNVRPG